MNTWRFWKASKLIGILALCVLLNFPHAHAQSVPQHTVLQPQNLVPGSLPAGCMRASVRVMTFRDQFGRPQSANMMDVTSQCPANTEYLMTFIALDGRRVCDCLPPTNGEITMRIRPVFLYCGRSRQCTQRMVEEARKHQCAWFNQCEGRLPGLN